MDSRLKTDIIYNCYKKNQHVIHVLTIDINTYSLELVKARGQVLGKETVEAIGLRKNANAAINSGFFEIGSNDDGRPSGTLIINGQLFGLSKQLQALLILDQNNIKIIQGKAKIVVEVGKVSITPDQVNCFSNSQDITLYNDVWAPSSLTTYGNKEIVVDDNFVVTEVSDHGDNSIPPQGLVLSFPPGKIPLSISKGDHVRLNLEFTDEGGNSIKLSKAASIVSSPQLLVQNCNIVNLNKEPKGVSMPHARTALGIRQDGNINIVVVEHLYKKCIKNFVQCEQIKSIVHNLWQGTNHLKETDHSIKTTSILSKILDVLDKEFSEVIGFTIEELANYMIELGCVTAINLDGGGSSTLFMNGKIINNPTDDNDKAFREDVVRLVSDAIIIKYKGDKKCSIGSAAVRE